MAAAAVRAVGEGFLRPNYEELPIDVQYTKLLGAALFLSALSLLWLM